MSSYDKNYFQDMKDYMQKKTQQERENYNAFQRSIQNRNAKVLVIKDGRPLYISSDSNGNVIDIEICNDMSYKTRNAIYNADKLVYEKYINGDFKYSSVDAGTKTALKGQPLDIVTRSLHEIKLND